MINFKRWCFFGAFRVDNKRINNQSLSCTAQKLTSANTRWKSVGDTNTETRCNGSINCWTISLQDLSTCLHVKKISQEIKNEWNTVSRH